MENTVHVQAERIYRDFNSTTSDAKNVNLEIKKTPNIKSMYTVSVSDPDFHPFFNTIIDGYGCYILANNNYQYTIWKRDVDENVWAKLKTFVPTDEKRKKCLEQFYDMQCDFKQQSFQCIRYEKEKPPENTTVTLTICSDNSTRGRNDIDQLSETDKDGNKICSYDLLDVSPDRFSAHRSILEVYFVKTEDNPKSSFVRYLFEKENSQKLVDFWKERNMIIHTEKEHLQAQHAKPAFCVRCALQN
jgi:hypothetical protein